MAWGNGSDSVKAAAVALWPFVCPKNERNGVTRYGKPTETPVDYSSSRVAAGDKAAAAAVAVVSIEKPWRWRCIETSDGDYSYGF